MSVTCSEPNRLRPSPLVGASERVANPVGVLGPRGRWCVARGGTRCRYRGALTALVGADWRAEFARAGFDTTSSGLVQAMPVFEHNSTTIHYETRGKGFPLLLLAPGGMNSTIDFWERATINPLVDLGEVAIA